MAPIAIYDPAIKNIAVNKDVDLLDIKAKVVVDQVEIDLGPKPPVADDYMYDFKYNHPLPTTDVLGTDIPADVDAKREAEDLVSGLSDTLERRDAQAFADLFLEYGTILSAWALVGYDYTSWL